jgi:Electron transfer DM13
MKHYSLIFILCVTMAACTKNESTPTNASTLSSADSVLVGSTSTIIAMGNFINAVHPASGKASWHVAGTKQTIYLSNFSTDAGPDLKVYLSKDLNASSFILLGDLKATSGNHIYPITISATPSEYKYVLIWCQRFSVLFGSARIQ